MKIRLPILATALASTLALAPGLTQASTWYEEYVEYVYYEFEYFKPYLTVAVEEVWDSDAERFYRRASVGTDPGGYQCLDPADPYWDCETIWFGFHLEGGEIVPLDNLTFDLKAFPATLGGYALTSWSMLDYFIDYSTEDDVCWNSSFGSISFGPTGEIASYDMGYASECAAATSFQASSSPILLTDLFGDDLDSIEGAELLEGLFAYDSRYWEPYDLYYSQRPGFWRTSISRLCGYEIYWEGDTEPGDFIDTPCPGDEIVTPGPGPSIITPPAPIPLPAAGWLLLGALGTLGLARRRRG